MNKLKKILNYELTSRLSGKGVKVKTLLIFVICGLMLTPILSSVGGENLYSIAVSENGDMVAYVSDGDYIPEVLHLCSSDGTTLFEHEFTPEENGGGRVVTWFLGDEVCAYALRQDLLITFSYDGTVVSKVKAEDYDYPERYADFEKSFSAYTYKNNVGIYTYCNNNFVLGKKCYLNYEDNDGNVICIWKCVD